jgi:hypothetical protein
MIKLDHDQQKAYDRFIRARNKVYGRKSKWVRAADYTCTVDMANMNHPLFELNDEYQEYKDSFQAWLAVEPDFRKQERMRASRGDYGTMDSWDDKPSKIKEL